MQAKARNVATPKKAKSARKRGPYKKSQKTRQAILAAALKEVGTVGFQRASVDAIARRAGVGIGNLYYHFASRDEIVDQLLESLLSQRLEFELDTGTAGGTLLERIESRLRGYLALVRRNPAYIRLFEELRMHRPDIYRRRVGATLSLARRELREAAARGEIRAMDEKTIAVVAHLLLGAFYFLDQMMEDIDGQEYPGDDFVVAVYTAFIRRALESAG